MTERLHFHFSLSCTGERNGSPLQRSCLENPRNRGAWWAAIYGVAQSGTQLKQLSSSSSPCFWWVKYSQDLSVNILFCCCPTLCDLMDCSPLGPWDSPGKNTRTGCYFLLKGIFPTQGSNLGLLIIIKQYVMHIYWVSLKILL